MRADFQNRRPGTLFGAKQPQVNLDGLSLLGVGDTLLSAWPLVRIVSYFLVSCQPCLVPVAGRNCPHL